MSATAAPARQREPRSLKATFRAAERLRESIERGAFHSGNSALPASGVRLDSVGTPLSYGDAVREALAAYAECRRRVDQLALFSSNESVEDISTAHLPYLLLPFREAELRLKLPTAQPGPTERRAVLRDAREAYERFLHLLDGYGLLTAPYAKLLAQYTEDPIHFSTLGPMGSGGGGGGGGGGIGSGMAGLADPAARRNAKIAGFRAEKELRSKLDVLRQRQEQRRELARRRKLRMREHEGGAQDQDGDEQTEGGRRNVDNDNDDDDDDDEDEDADEDDEEARKLHLAAVFYSAHMAFQGLEGINVEDDILAKAPVPLLPGPSATAGGLGDNRQRQKQQESGGGDDGGDSTRIDDMHRMGNAPILRRLQSALGTAPTWSGNGPLLTKDGKPKQPFTILGSRAEMARNVFRPGHNLPTMSIDEYLEEERKRGGIIEGGGPSSGMPPVPDEDNYEKADAETMKQRAWDEFVEANPKGAGNTLNRG